MDRYRIENTHSAVILWEGEAETEEQALDLMAKNAGFTDYAECNREVPAKPGEILVTIV